MKRSLSDFDIQKKASVDLAMNLHGGMYDPILWSFDQFVFEDVEHIMARGWSDSSESDMSSDHRFRIRWKKSVEEIFSDWKFGPESQGECELEVVLAAARHPLRLLTLRLAFIKLGALPKCFL